jgi:hypothetical protein
VCFGFEDILPPMVQKIEELKQMKLKQEGQMQKLKARTDVRLLKDEIKRLNHLLDRAEERIEELMK